MSNEEWEKRIAEGTACPWCWHKFRTEDQPLKHGATGQRYCDRNCYELDVKYPARKE